MSLSNFRICNVPGCPEIVENSNGKCRAHKRKAQREADKRTGRIRGSRWTSIRKTVLTDSPFCSCQGCESCDTAGGTRCLREAVEIDHILPLSHGGHPTSLENLQGLCRSCHETKTKSEQHGVIRED